MSYILNIRLFGQIRYQSVRPVTPTVYDIHRFTGTETQQGRGSLSKKQLAA